MNRSINAEDVLKYAAGLSPHQRIQLINRMVSQGQSDDAVAYQSLHPGHEEFTSEEAPLAWDTEDWNVTG